jgi:hypothetical protein
MGLNRRKIVGASLVGELLLFAATGHAAIQAYNYISDSTSYTTTPGVAITAHVYFEESGGTTLIAGDGGLATAGFSVTRGSIGLPANPSVISSIAGSVTSNGDSFPGGRFKVQSGGSPSFMAGANSGIFGATTGPVPAGGLIEIGSITITGGTIAGTTNFTLGNQKYPASIGGFTQTLDTGYDLDLSSIDPVPYIGAGGAAGAESFSVIVVPEPTSPVFFAVGASALLMRMRRNRRRIPPPPYSLGLNPV